MAGVELATGYVTLTVETSDVSKQIGMAFKSAENQASATGVSIGKALGEGVRKADTSPIDKLSKSLEAAKDDARQLSDRYEQTQQKIEQSAQKSATAQENASRQVAIAERKVEEAREKARATAIQVTVAEEKVREIRAKGNASASQVASAEQKVEAARARASASVSQVMTAEDKAQRSRQKLSEVTDKAERENDGYAESLSNLKSKVDLAEDEVSRLTKEFDKVSSEAKEAASGVEQTGGRFARAFSGLKDKVRGSVNGAFKPVSDEASEAFDKVERESTSAGSRVGNSFKDSLKGTLVGIGAYVGIQEIGSGLWSAVTNAGDLEQSVGAMGSVFGDSSFQMDQWSRQASDSVGLARNEYNELSVTLGSLLKNGGTPIDELAGKTDGLVQLGADLASMYGGTTADAVGALSSALKGEMDPIEKYGISLNDAALTAKGLEMGIEKTGGAFTNQQKQLIVQRLLMDQSADAQGNFMREQDTFAHKQQVAKAKLGDLSAQLGEVFLPVLTKVMGFLGDTAVPVFSEVIGGVRAFGAAWVANDGEITSSGFPGFMEQSAYSLRQLWDGFMGVLPWITPFAIGLGVAVGVLKLWRGAIVVTTGVQAAWALVNGTLAGTFWGLTAAQWAAVAPTLAWVAGIALVVGALILAYQRVGWFRDMVNGAWSWITATTGAFVDWFKGVAVPAIQTALQVAGQWFMGLWTTYVIPAWNGIVAAVQWAWGAIIKPIFDEIGWVITNVLAPVFTWLWGTIIVPAWNGIVTVISWAWTSIISPLFGMISSVITGILAPVFVWLWQNVITPAWNAISAIISWAWNSIVKPVFTAIVWTLQNVVGPVIEWLYSNVVKPVWDLITWVIQGAWRVIEGVFWALHGVLTNVIGPVFNWLWERVVEPIFTWISDKISGTWSWLRDSVFTPFGRFMEEDFMPVFAKVRDGIGKAWEGLKDKVKEPVEFVVVTVINDALIKGYNKLNDFWSGTDLDPITLPQGWAHGGYTGDGGKYEPAGVVHRGEYVIPKESTQALMKDQPGLLESMHHYSGSPRKKGEAAGWVGSESYTSGAPLSGTSSPIWGGLQQQMSQAGKLYIPKQTISGVDTEDVAKAWMGRSALQLIMGNGSPGVRFTHGTAGPWGFAQGNTIQINPSAPSNMATAILRHELGHILSLHHTDNTGSIMHPSIAGAKVPTALDYGALVKAWGKPGEGVKKYDVGDGGGGPAWLGKVVEMFTDPVRNVVGGVASKFKGNGFVEAPVGIVNNMLDGVEQWVMDQFGGSSDSGSVETGGGAERWRGTITDALKRAGLPTTSGYVDAWLRQVQSESGGNPRAVQNGYVDVNTGGNEAAGLLQVIPSTFAAYRDPSLPNDRFNPLSSAVAGMRYAKSRYGVEGMLRVIGKGHGYSGGGEVTGSSGFARAFSGLTPTLYDDGGILERGVQLIDHKRSTPDYVLTANQWDDIHHIANTVSTREGVTLNIQVVAPEGMDPGTLGRRVGEAAAFELSKIGDF